MQWPHIGPLHWGIAASLHIHLQLVVNPFNHLLVISRGTVRSSESLVASPVLNLVEPPLVSASASITGYQTLDEKMRTILVLTT